MMHKYIIPILLLLLPGSSLMARESSVKERVDGLDSLVFYHRFAEAGKEADQLYTILSEDRKNKGIAELRLRVMLHQQFIFHRIWRSKESMELVNTIINEAQEYHLPGIEYEAHLAAAKSCEITGELKLCEEHLASAHKLYKVYELEHLYSIYCNRIASLYRHINKTDSAIYYTQAGLKNAIEYHSYLQEATSHLLLGMLLAPTDLQRGIVHSRSAAERFLRMNDHETVCGAYAAIGQYYAGNGKYDVALRYNDTALFALQKSVTRTPSQYWATFISRSQIFDSMGKVDSAYLYYRKFHDSAITAMDIQNSVEFNNIETRYASDRKEATIKNKDQQLILIGCILLVITIAVVIVVRKNKRISAQNKVISRQVEELMKTLSQKQVLLSELQHRVKNNLQHVISILEIQKESVDFNNIDELIRGNQNRIHSMALLHKKLNISDSINEVDLKKYITELSELVKGSYSNHQKYITLTVDCDIEKISIEKALPLGLIIVELVSNSMKHAFRKQRAGSIQVSITNGHSVYPYKLLYADNGSGFDFNKTSEKGLGMEIIKGLIGQLDATAESNSKNGFELILCFK